MKIIILTLCICNLFTTAVVGWAVGELKQNNSCKKDSENKPEAPIAPKKEVNEAEKERVFREQQRRAEEWNNFFSYTGDVQTKKGGD